MTTVAIHQPNYAPWLGYFYKMARADIFVFLDDVQFSKGSYINRVQILWEGSPRWLTQPVSVSLGTAISDVSVAQADWARTHLDTLRGAYRSAGAFESVWPDMEAIYHAIPDSTLGGSNETLIGAFAQKLGIQRKSVVSSSIETAGLTGDDRLISIVGQLATEGTYLSGEGGGKYQNPDKFTAAGIALEYVRFEHPVYDQGRQEFVPGLSVLDAVFHLGWDGAAGLIAN